MKFKSIKSDSRGNSQSKLILKGQGFGDFKNLNLINLLINLPIFLYLVFRMWPKIKQKTLLKTLIYSLRSGQVFGYDLTRMAFTIEFLSKQIGNLNNKSIVIIGDGYGRLGGLVKFIYPSSQITYINLGRTLLFDFYYSNKVFPNAKHAIIINGTEKNSDFNYIEAENYSSIPIPADIFVNIASMQEMNYKDILSYFNLITTQTQMAYFYCCNRVSKKLPDGSQINIKKYPWKSLEIKIDELCPWHQEFPTSKPPFVRKFDGPIQHILAVHKPK